jgi:phage shock protein PspC (stress-responsive transcriptional regulator)
MVASGVVGDAPGMTEQTAEQPTMGRLQRSRSDRMLAGVCGGLARTFGIHPAFYRVGFVVLTLVGGAGILIYLAATLVIPDEGKQDSIAAEILRDGRDRPWPLIGLGLVVTAGVVLLSRVTLWPEGDAAWILILLAGLAVVLVARRRSAAPAAPLTPTDPTAPLPAADAPAPSAATEAAVARRGWGAGRIVLVSLASLFALVLVAAAIFVAVFPVHLSHGVGSKSFTPVAVADLQPTYRLGAGQLKLDLTQLRLPIGETEVKARVDYGDLNVIVPPGVAVRAYGKARLGYVSIFGNEDSGRNADQHASAAGRRVLTVDARVQVGSVRIERAVR